jgi:hypothetical protein
MLVRLLQLGDLEHVGDDRVAAEFQFLAAAAGTGLVNVHFAGHEW